MASTREEKLNFAQADAGGYDSSFEDEEEDESEKRRQDLAKKPIQVRESHHASKSYFTQEVDRENRKHYWEWRGLTAYQKHVQLINTYYLHNKGVKLPARDSTRDKRDIDVIRENHQFLWDNNEDTRSWEKRLAKRYYDKLFKEFCITDLSMFKETKKLALRWRTESEVIDGKGQFVCGEKRCTHSEGLQSWEVNFAYKEHGVQKNALVKLKLCPSCSSKLNHHHKHKLVEKKKDPLRGSKYESSHVSKKKNKRKSEQQDSGGEGSSKEAQTVEDAKDAENLWKEPVKIEEKDEEERITDFLDSLFC